MNFFDLIQARQSIRQYRDQPLEADKLQRILEAANAAPSAGNRQAYEIYRVCSPETRRLLSIAARDQEFIAQAPVTLVFCTHPQRNADRYGERGATLYSLQDATIAATFAMLAAAGLGLGTVWVGAFRENEVRQVLGLPEDQRPVILLPVGYPAEQPPRRPRRALDDLVHDLG